MIPTLSLSVIVLPAQVVLALLVSAQPPGPSAVVYVVVFDRHTICGPELEASLVAVNADLLHLGLWYFAGTGL